MEAVIGHPMGMQNSQSPARPVTLCVLLWANPGTASGLIAYEDKVLGIAAAHVAYEILSALAVRKT